MESRTLKLFAIASAVLFAGVALAGCTSTKNPNEDELGAAFVKRSCTEKTPESTATAGVLDTTHALSSTAPAVAAQQTPTEIVIGTFMPRTGDYAAFGVDMERAAALAAKQINAATGSPVSVRLVGGDDKSTDTSGAPAGFQDLVAQGAQAVVGATSSGVTAAILESAKNSKVVLITASATAPSLTTDHDNQGYFWRVPPSDALQGKVLADLVWSDGCKNANIIALNNDYGRGLGTVFKQSFEQKGGTVGEFVRYETTATTFTSEVQRVARGDPDAIVYVGAPQSGSLIVKEAFTQGKMKKSVWFFSEGVKDNAFVTGVGKAQNPETRREEFVTAGLRGTAPAAAGSAATDLFKTAWAQEYPDDADGPGLFAPESYDAVMLVALAAAKSLKEHPGAIKGEWVKDYMQDVANKGTADQPATGANIGPALLTASTGGNVDYQGAAGDFDFDDKGDPASGTYAFWKVGDDGKIVEYKSGVKPGEPVT